MNQKMERYIRAASRVLASYSIIFTQQRERERERELASSVMAYINTYIGFVRYPSVYLIYKKGKVCLGGDDSSLLSHHSISTMKENGKCQVKWRRRRKRNDIDVCALRWSLAPFNVDILREKYEEDKNLLLETRECTIYKSRYDSCLSLLWKKLKNLYMCVCVCVCVCKLYTTGCCT